MLKNLYILLLMASLTVLLSCKGSPDSHSNSAPQVKEDVSVGVALYSFNRFSFPETLQKSQQADVNRVEGFFFHQLGEQFDNKRMAQLTDDEMSALRELIRESGLKMPSMYAGGETVEEWEKQFEIGKLLGLSFLVGEPRPELWDAIHDMTMRYDIKLAIHQHAEGKSIFWHPDSVLVALEGRPNFGACGDLGHWVRSGLDPVGCLKKLEGHLISIHAKDLDEFGNQDANDVKIGSGVIDYPAILTELKRQNFHGPIYVECEHDWDDNLADVKYAVEYIRGIHKELD